MHQGDDSGWVLLCLSGRLKVVYAAPNGTEIVLAVRGPGDLIGELSARDGLPRSATVQAIEPGITSRLPERRFDELVQRLGLRAQLDSYVFGKLRESASHAWQLAHRTTALRLAAFIAAVIDAAGPDHPSPTTIAMSQEELASALGSPRSSITPVLAEWKSAGLIRTSRGRFDVVDIPALIGLAVSNSGQNYSRSAGRLVAVTYPQARRDTGEPGVLGRRPPAQ